jgi:putative FmdB family regulatory protein
MPLYTYRCAECGYSDEQMRSHRHRNRRKPCPNCATGTLNRGIDVPAGLITKSAQIERATESIQSPERPANRNTTSVIMDNTVMSNSDTGIVSNGADVTVNGLTLDGVTRPFVTDERARLKLRNVAHDAGPDSRARKHDS